MKKINSISIVVLALSVLHFVNSAPARTTHNQSYKNIDKNLAPFSFKSIEAGIETDPHKVGECNISNGDPNKLTCDGYDPEVAGINLLVAPKYDFYQLKLTSMFFIYPNRGANFATFADAFTQKYGPACKREVSKWRNSMGAVLDNPTFTWCFSTGQLTLQAIGTDIRYGLAIYEDKNSAPTARAKVDF